MQNLEFVVNTGIGDLIHTAQLLDKPLSEGNKINIVLGVAQFDSVKNILWLPRIEFLVWLVDVLFQKRGYEAYFSANRIGNSPQVLLNFDFVSPAIPDFSRDFLGTSIENKKSNRIVLLTKVRAFSKNVLSTYEQSIRDALQELSKSNEIVIVGERDIEFNAEYKIHGTDMIYSLYSYFKKIIPGAVDMTLPALGITSPTRELFIKDCALMNSAKRVICFGSGGNVSIAMSTSRIINLYGGTEMAPLFCTFKRSEEKLVTNNVFEFLNELRTIE
jgi:hypothetical protein